MRDYTFKFFEFLTYLISVGLESVTARTKKAVDGDPLEKLTKSAI